MSSSNINIGLIASVEDRARYDASMKLLDKRIRPRGRNDELDDGGLREEEVGGRNSDALGLNLVRPDESKGKPAQGRAKASGPEPAQIDFSVPVPRGVRPMTPDGRTSFHFSQVCVTRTRQETRSETGKVNRPGAASKHDSYIQRDSAVANLDAHLALDLKVGQEGESANQSRVGDHGDGREAADAPAWTFATLAINPEVQARFQALQGQLQQIEQDIERRYHGWARQEDDGSSFEVPSLSSLSHVSSLQHLTRLGHQARAGGVEGLSALRQSIAAETDGVKVISNAELSVAGSGALRNSPAQHGEYVERQEALAQLDGGTKVLFTNISNDPAERAAVWDKIEEFEPLPGPDIVKVEPGMSAAMRRDIADDPDCPADLRKGILAASLEKESVIVVSDIGLSEAVIRRHPDYHPKGSQVKFAPGRGGRTQYRIIGELPHDLSVAENASILREFCAEFERRKLSYVAVMHAPDQNNDARNWHFHLVYYDRPIKKQADGRWDFEIEERYITKYHQRRSHFPYRKNKVREVNSRHWIPNLRKRLADITNRHFERAGIERRLDPRKYEEMGIHREPQEHLGTNASALEARGYITTKGAENAYKDWAEFIGRVALEHERALRDSEVEAEKQRVRIRELSTVERPSDPTLVDKWIGEQIAAAEYRAMAEMIDARLAMGRSRAAETETSCKRHIDGLQSRQLQPRDAKRLASLTARHDEATAYVRSFNEDLAEIRAASAEWRVEAARLQASANAMLRTIQDLGAAKPLPDFQNVVVQHDGMVTRTPPVNVDVDHKARALSALEIKAFVEDITFARRSVEARGGRIVPVKLKVGEAAIIKAPNYSTVSELLLDVFRRQSKVAKELAAYIRQTPSSIRYERSEGRSAPVFHSSQQKLVRDFQDYSEHPWIIKAVQEVHAVNADASERSRPEAEAPSGAGERTADKRAAAGRPALPNRPSTDLNPIFQRLSREPIRIISTNEKLIPDERFLAESGLRPDDFDSSPAQARMRGLQVASNREITRLIAYVRSCPSSLMEAEGRIVLNEKAPLELRQIAHKWRSDEALQAGWRQTMRAGREARSWLAPRRVEPGAASSAAQAGLRSATAINPADLAKAINDLNWKPNLHLGEDLAKHLSASSPPETERSLSASFEELPAAKTTNTPELVSQKMAANMEADPHARANVDKTPPALTRELATDSRTIQQRQLVNALRQAQLNQGIR